MLPALRNWFRQRIIRRSIISPAEWQEAFVSLPLLSTLSDRDKQTLRELAILFMHRKNFEGAHELSVTQRMKLIIALQACLPILQLGIDAYDGWVSIIVHPAGFATEHVMIDEDGVAHNVKSGLSGESWLRGPVVLAWDETEHAGIIDGSNLVIHEFAHKLDMLNGRANGFPPLHKDMNTTDWVEAFTHAYEDLQQRCAHGRSHDIDCYAATSPAEFFAVASEVFFERPRVLQRHYTAVYEQLRLYYRQDTLARMA